MHTLSWPCLDRYAATFQRVDTKQHYVPHTRTRVYLLAIDMAAPNRRAVALGTASKEETPPPSLKVSPKRVNELPKWVAAINELSRPSSAALEAFILPTDDPRVHRGNSLARGPPPLLSTGTGTHAPTPPHRARCACSATQAARIYQPEPCP